MRVLVVCVLIVFAVCLYSLHVWGSMPSLAAVAKDSHLPIFGVTTHDFGMLVPGASSEQRTHTFRIKNTGSDELRIQSIRASCGCMHAEATEQVVAPASSISLTVVLKDFSAHRFSEHVTVWFEEWDRPLLLTLTASTQMSRDAKVSPSRAVFPPEGMSLEILLTDGLSDLMPSQPLIEVDPEARDIICAKFVEWRLLHAREASEGRPARWRGVIDVRPIMGACVKGSRMIRAASITEENVIRVRVHLESVS